jgi:hypothetical protein
MTHRQERLEVQRISKGAIFESAIWNYFVVYVIDETKVGHEVWYQAMLAPGAEMLNQPLDALHGVKGHIALHWK